MRKKESNKTVMNLDKIPARTNRKTAFILMYKSLHLYLVKEHDYKISKMEFDLAFK
jgi:hypothetical protein